MAAVVAVPNPVVVKVDFEPYKLLGLAGLVLQGWVAVAMEAMIVGAWLDNLVVGELVLDTYTMRCHEYPILHRNNSTRREA